MFSCLQFYQFHQGLGVSRYGDSFQNHVDMKLSGNILADCKILLFIMLTEYELFQVVSSLVYIGLIDSLLGNWLF